MMAKSSLGKVVTFYSYKGGTGRSMALANVACALSQGENRPSTLMIDWDLEAPGLHRYFQYRIQSTTFSSFDTQPGLIDLFYKLRHFCEENRFVDENIPDTIFDDIHIEEYILKTNVRSLYLMTAGRFDRSYATCVANFDWNDFYTQYPSLIPKFAEYLARNYDWTLIDARTGHSDISGICTTLMPDRLVTVFTPNYQSISGVLDIARNAIEYRKQSDDLRQLVVFPLVSRVDTAEQRLRDDWRRGNQGMKIPGYQPEFQELFQDIYGLSQCDLTSYFDDVQIQYVPSYAYGEKIAILEERSEDRLSIARSYESFAQRLIEQERPWENIRIAQSTTIEKPERKPKPEPRAGWGFFEKTVFIGYRRTTVPWALAIYQHLTMHGYDVFFDYQSIPSGSFEQVILENIRTRAHFVVILTPSALERCKEPGDWLRREIETAMDERRNIVPLMLDSFDFGSPLVKEALTGKLAALSAYNGVRVYSEYFFAAMDKLREQFLNVELADAALHQIEDETREITGTQKSVAGDARPVEKEQLTAQEWFERGYVHATETKNREEAVRCFTEATRLDPSLGAAHNNLGILLSDLKRYEEAETAYRKAIDLDPSDASAYYNLGNLLSNLKRYEEAETAYRKAIDLDPSLANAYSNLGNLMSYLERYKEAEAVYRKAIELDPSSANAYGSLGFLFDGLKRYKEAEAVYRKAIELDPSDASAYKNLALGLRRSHRLEEALAVYRQRVEIEPDNAYPYLAIASIQKDMGRGISEQHIKKVRQLMPENDWYDRACLESVCDNFDLAFEYLQRAADEGKLDPEWAWEDPDLQWIRNDPRFEEIVGPRPQ